MNSIISVQMFGGFSVSYNDNQLRFKTGASTKSMQILQILFAYYPEKVSKQRLLKELFEYSDVLSPGNNLKVSISQLRTFLKKELNNAGLDCGNIIEFEKGNYFLNSPVPISVDIHNFSEEINAVKKSTNDFQRNMHLDKAIKLYSGSFLSEVPGIDWIEKLSAYYQNLYHESVRNLADHYISESRYEECYNLFEAASSIQHTEEWQIGKINCMMKLGNWDKAKKIYNESVQILEKEFSVSPSDEMVSRYKLISEHIEQNSSSLREMINDIKEENDDDGAYYCAFPGFVDSCRVMSRNMERNGFSCYLMMINLTDSSGNSLNNPQKTANASEALYQTIKQSLRRGDMFTKYNLRQYIIFLFGTTYENCDIVKNRIASGFHHESVRGVKLDFEISTAILDNLNQLINQ